MAIMANLQPIFETETAEQSWNFILGSDVRHESSWIVVDGLGYSLEKYLKILTSLVWTQAVSDWTCISGILFPYSIILTNYCTLTGWEDCITNDYWRTHEWLHWSDWFHCSLWRSASPTMIYLHRSDIWLPNWSISLVFGGFSAREALPRWDVQIQSLCFQVNNIIEKIGASAPQWMANQIAAENGSESMDWEKRSSPLMSISTPLHFLRLCNLVISQCLIKFILKVKYFWFIISRDYTFRLSVRKFALHIEVEFVCSLFHFAISCGLGIQVD